MISPPSGPAWSPTQTHRHATTHHHAASGPLQVMCGIDGREQELGHLTGYRGPAPVRIGRGGSMRELATRKLVQPELRPSRVRLDEPRNIAVSPRALRGGTASANEPGTPDVPPAPAVRSGVVLRCALFERLAGAERVVQMSAPAGSGKTVLMRSWITEAGLAGHTGWVPVDREVRHPRRFWIG